LQLKFAENNDNKRAFKNRRILFVPDFPLPFWFLYLIADLLYLILYRIVGYRKQVIRQNLANAFPKNQLLKENLSRKILPITWPI
jgi:lauroyl/myristoyl acyltransferase